MVTTRLFTTAMASACVASRVKSHRIQHHRVVARCTGRVASVRDARRAPSRRQLRGRGSDIAAIVDSGRTRRAYGLACFPILAALVHDTPCAHARAPAGLRDVAQGVRV